MPCVTPEQLTGRYSRIVLAVKAHATETAMTQLLPDLHDDKYVLSAQNGLNERVGSARTMGAFVNYGADWICPGRILFCNRGAVVVGEVDGSPRHRTTEMHRLLQIFAPEAVLTQDIFAYRWGKLGYSAMLFATALTPDSMQANSADPARAPALIAFAREVMQTAVAEGVNPKPFNGFEPRAFLPGAADTAALQGLADLAFFNSKTAKTHTGIYRDLAVRKRKTEADPQVGAVANIAAGHGIDTPALIRLVELIHDIEDGRRDISAKTFHELTKVLT
ncbi:MAG: ketopantoate reductase C-terminal domain-containing protein [Sedimentitalea sp.]|uniref:ketopantoate reductase family protein n=1 Tax=Sedimentitalea sp. TaxID=2048915 RepID=UPI003267D8AF